MKSSSATSPFAFTVPFFSLLPTDFAYATDSMLARISSVFGGKSYDHELLVFGSEAYSLRATLHYDPPTDRLHVQCTSIFSLPLELELIGEVDGLASQGHVAIRRTISKAANAVIAKDPDAKLSMLRLFEGIKTTYTPEDGDSTAAAPLPVYHARVTTSHETRLKHPIEPTSFPQRGYL